MGRDFLAVQSAGRLIRLARLGRRGTRTGAVEGCLAAGCGRDGRAWACRGWWTTEDGRLDALRAMLGREEWCPGSGWPRSLFRMPSQLRLHKGVVTRVEGEHGGLC